MDSPELLEIRNLSIGFTTETGKVEAVKNVSLTLKKGETLAIVGESGSGKSVTALSLTRLLPEPPATYDSGEILLKGVDVLKMSSSELRSIRGARIAYIFQEPSTSLNPVFTIGFQIAENLRYHTRLRGRQLRDKVVDLLRTMGIPLPERRAREPERRTAITQHCRLQ